MKTKLSICVFTFAAILALRHDSFGQEKDTKVQPVEKGEKTSWHGFDRYDFVMDDQTLVIKAFKAPTNEKNSVAPPPKGMKRCIVVVPKQAAPGNPWSWQACYWDHEPQAEVELLRRGFHIAFITPDPGKQWDAWYKYLVKEMGLAKKAAFIGMSKGGVNEFNWGVVNPDKVACIYADNTALYDEDFAKIPALAKHDVPLLHICGSEDFLLQRHTRVVEDTYHQLGGLITVIVKEGHAHHRHSLQNAKPIADWIEQHMTPSTANRPAFVDATFTKGYYYSLEPSFIYLKEEDSYATARGPGFTECYDRYDGPTSGKFKMGGMSIVVPKTVAPGKPWVFTGDALERDATVEQALLAKGYHILILSPMGSGMTQKQWNDAYQLLVNHGFSNKPVLKGIGPKAGEAYAWAIANPDKVSCIYARNPLMKSLMAVKQQPIDNLAPLAKAGVPVLHDCGALDPWLDSQTRVVEKRYKELDGKISVIVRAGEGHFPLSPKDPKSVVDFIIKNTPIAVKADTAPISLDGGGAVSTYNGFKKQAGDSFRWKGRGQVTSKVQVAHVGDYEVALSPGAVGQHLQVPFLLASSHAVPTELHVHPRGDDNNLGTSAKPLRTFDGARAAVRKLVDKKEPVSVHFASGTYYSNPVIFHAIDSGTATAPIIYQAATGAEVVISGGSLLQLDWTSFKDGIFKARVPEGFDTDQIFVNGLRMHLARYPNFDAKAQYFGGTAADAFSNERATRWTDPRGGFIHAMHGHMWGDFHYAITGKDANGAVTFEGGWQNNRQSGMHKQLRFVENIFEELDAPGEWFLDAKNRTLYLYPPKNVDLKTAVVEAVQQRNLIEFRGDLKNPVTHVHLKGFLFRHSGRTFMDTKEPLLRSDWTIYRGGAVFFQGAEDCSLENCNFEQLGGNAIFVSNYNRRVVLRGCHVDQAGANSIAFVGDPAAVRSPLFEYGQKLPLEKLDLEPGPKTANYPADCLVENCLLVANGRFEKQTAGVQIAMAMRIKVRHCSIYDCPRAGINIGDGCWGGHVIEYCDVFDTVKETGDHGSFNSWGRDRYWVSSIEEVNKRISKNKTLPFLDTVEPIILRNNRWRCDHGWDIDLDDGSSNYRIENNLSLKGGIKFREGFLRWLLNNIMVNNSFHPHVWFRESQDEVRHNILFTAYRPIGMPKKWGKEVDFNWFVDGKGLKQAQALGLDTHSVAGDPKFINPEQGDFRVEASSGVLKLGVRNFAMDQFGVVNPRLKAIARTPKIDLPKIN